MNISKYLNIYAKLNNKIIKFINVNVYFLRDSWLYFLFAVWCRFGSFSKK
jgi:hypothetical protein